MSERSIALVDDHHMVRAGLAAMVNELGGYRVTLEAGNGQELIEALQRAEGPAPSLAIVDLNMPVMDGYDTIRWLRGNKPHILPLALTFDATDDARLKAVRAGARGFVLKNASPDVLKLALDSLVHTGFFYSNEVQDAVQRNPDLKTEEERMQDLLRTQITDRELDFLRLVCSDEELTYDAIGERMGVHRRSVDNYRIGLFTKFNVKSKTGLVLFAMRWGLVK